MAFEAWGPCGHADRRSEGDDRKRLLCWKAYLPRSYGTQPMTRVICARPSLPKAALAVIPNNPSRALKYPLPSISMPAHLVEWLLKTQTIRRVATRFRKTARNYLAVVTLAASSYGCDKWSHTT